MEGSARMSLSSYDAMQEALRNTMKRLEEQDRLLFEFRQNIFPDNGEVMTQLRIDANKHAQNDWSDTYNRMNTKLTEKTVEISSLVDRLSKCVGERDKCTFECSGLHIKIDNYRERSWLYRLFNNI